MGRTTFDWRWIIVIVVALIFFGQVRLSPSSEFGVLLLALGGYWAIQAALTPWRERGSLLGSTKVTYWRGQRIELPVGGSRGRRTRFRTPDATPLAVSIVYMVLGAGCVYAALRLLYLIVTR